MSTIGENIRKRRIILNMTQEELASKMGYKSKSTINKIELGKNDIPQSKIVQFAEVLCTTPRILMGWEEEQKSNSILVDIVAKLRSDKELMLTVEKLCQLDKDELEAINRMISAFKK